MLFTFVISNAEIICKTTYKPEADYIVYVTKYKSEANLIVYAITF